MIQREEKLYRVEKWKTERKKTTVGRHAGEGKTKSGNRGGKSAGKRGGKR